MDKFVEAAAALICELRVKKETISFGEAKKRLGYRPDTKFTFAETTAEFFEKAEKGGSALLCDRHGFYATTEATKSHPETLKDWGFDRIPEYKEKEEKKEKKEKKDSKEELIMLVLKAKMTNEQKCALLAKL